MIQALGNTNVNITECNILWMIIGNPSKLLVFSPKNREAQVALIKKAMTIQPDISHYKIEINFPLSQGYNILVNVKNHVPLNIKLVEWSKNYINFYINSNINDSSMVF